MGIKTLATAFIPDSSKSLKNLPTTWGLRLIERTEPLAR